MLFFKKHIMNWCKTVNLIGLGIFLLSCFQFASANDINAERIVPIMTLLVKKYSELENALQLAITQKDRQKISLFLAPDFEERLAQHPISPIAREDWIHSKLTQKQDTFFHIEQMAVREVGNSMIVSYLLKTTRQKTGQFIVDIWQEKPQYSQLLARYSKF